AKDLGGNVMFLNYPGPSAPDSSWLADGSTPNSKTVANYIWTRFAVDLSAPIAKMVCPEYVTRPINNDQVIRVVRGDEPEIRIEIKDRLVADSMNADTYLDAVNGEDHLAEYTAMHPIYVHENEYYPSYSTLVSGMWREIAPGTGVAANNFGILLTLYQTDCTDSLDNRFNPSNFTWDDGNIGGAQQLHHPTTDSDPWGIPDQQILIADTSSAYGVTLTRTNDQNAVLSIKLNDPQFPLTDLSDGDVVLVEIVDAKVYDYLLTSTTPTVTFLSNDNPGYNQPASDGLHDRPNIKWSVYTDNVNFWVSNGAAYTNADHKSYPFIFFGNCEELTERFKFIKGFTQTGFEYAFANPNKHMLRWDETDSDDDGVHHAPEYSNRMLYSYRYPYAYADALPIPNPLRIAALANQLTVISLTGSGDAIQFATDTVGWFYVDQVGPMVDLDGVYPQFRRSPAVYDNHEYSNSFTSDPYQVITLDLADLSCRTYADSFAAGLDISSIVVNVKVMAIDGSYHPAYGPNGHNFVPVAANSLYSTPRAWQDACWYINDPTDPTTAMINGVAGTDGLPADNLSALDPGTRIIIDPRLGPPDASNLLGFGTGEPFMRFRNGDKVCVSVFARDASHGDCDIDLGNPIVNDDYAENGSVIANDSLFKYQFMVDLKEPELVLESDSIGCTNRAVMFYLIDNIEGRYFEDRCSQCSAGIDSIFFEIQHRNYNESTSSWDQPTIIRTATDRNTNFSVFMNPDYKDGFAGDSLFTATLAMTDDYNDPNSKTMGLMGAVIFQCNSFQDGDSVLIKVWGRDAIDVPWYPIDDDTVYALYPLQLTALQADQIDHRSQALGSLSTGTRMAISRRWDQHPNYDIDSMWSSNSTTNAGYTQRTYTKRFFYTTDPGSYWWTGYDWRNPADGETISNTVPPDKKFAFGNIHWLWQAPWSYDVLARTEGIPGTTALNTMNSNLIDNNAWDVENTDGSTNLNWTGTVVGNATANANDDNGAWSPGNVDNTSLWTMFVVGPGPTAAGTTRDQDDYDWTDLDSIWVANNTHHNWAKPLTHQFKILSSSYITQVHDIDPTNFENMYDDWRWDYGYNQDIIVPARSERTGVNQYRTGLVDSLSIEFVSCEPFYYCEDVTDTTVGFAMECYDSTGTIKWYWPFFMDSSKYGSGESRADWQPAFLADKASHNGGSLQAADWKYPVQYGWWDCDCPGCNGIRWTIYPNHDTLYLCEPAEAYLSVDLDKLATYTTSGAYQYLSVNRRSTTAYDDGDSVVIYTYTRTQGNDKFHGNDDHIIRNRYYYLIDRKAPTFTFNDLEMYVPQVEGDYWDDDYNEWYRNATFVEKGGSLENLEAKYGDLVRIKVNQAHDVVNSSRRSGVGLQGSIGDLFGWWGVHETPLQGKVLDPRGNPEPWQDGYTGWYTNTIAVQDDPLCRIVNHVDTTYFAAIQIADHSIEYREYVDTFFIILRDKLFNADTLKKPYVVDNIKPKLIWSYCDSTVNKQAFGSETFFGYWL
ncbi:MAG: hypothetical protein KBA26_13665, partial [Candidatus Delongbacteria bacterium]|nr:hypothetical protein [Candidatus Delongbacteria bacterium]